MKGYTNWENFDWKICFDDELPSDYFPSYGPHIEKVFVAEDKVSKATNEVSRTGEYSYLIGRASVSGDPLERSPIRPVLIPPKDPNIVCDDNKLMLKSLGITGPKVIGPCDIPYIASVWVMHKSSELKKSPDMKKVVAPPSTGEELIQHQQVGPSTGAKVTAPKANPGITQFQQGDVKLVYKLWNQDRTALIDQGEMVLKGIGAKWKYYEMEIPVLKQNHQQYLDVYVENDPGSGSGSFPGTPCQGSP